MEQAIQFCTAPDGVRLAYTTAGQGPTLVMVADWCGSLEGDWKRPETRTLWETLASHRRLVSFDRRGVGASQRDVDNFSLEAHVDDLAAVVDYLELELFDLWGAVDGAAVSVAYAAQYAQRVRRLALWAPFPYGLELAPPGPLSSLVEFMRGNWELATSTLADVAFPSGPIEAQKWVTACLRESVSAEAAARYVEFEFTVDIRPFLSHVQAPTLVLHRRGARDVPISHGTAAAALMPNARFVALDGDIYHPNFDHAQYLNLLEEFLGEEEELSTPKAPMEVASCLELGPPYPNALTEREAEVLQLLALGQSNKEIGAELVLSVRTVERHINNIYRKINGHNRAQATAYALAHGFALPG
jgi:pimeloyl-ACP methyl ester carboxylesterase/DNA-binding CsgD family transcriptional regulator